MLKTAIKKTAITKVLSCFLVFVILMSAVPVSVLAMDSSDGVTGDESRDKNIRALIVGLNPNPKCYLIGPKAGTTLSKDVGYTFIFRLLNEEGWLAEKGENARVMVTVTGGNIKSAKLPSSGETCFMKVIRPSDHQAKFYDYGGKEFKEGGIKGGSFVVVPTGNKLTVKITAEIDDVNGGNPSTAKKSLTYYKIAKLSADISKALESLSNLASSRANVTGTYIDMYRNFIESGELFKGMSVDDYTYNYVDQARFAGEFSGVAEVGLNWMVDPTAGMVSGFTGIINKIFGIPSVLDLILAMGGVIEDFERGAKIHECGQFYGPCADSSSACSCEELSNIDCDKLHLRYNEVFKKNTPLASINGNSGALNYLRENQTKESNAWENGQLDEVITILKNEGELVDLSKCIACCCFHKGEDNNVEVFFQLVLDHLEQEGETISKLIKIAEDLRPKPEVTKTAPSEIALGEKAVIEIKGVTKGGPCYGYLGLAFPDLNAEVLEQNPSPVRIVEESTTAPHPKIFYPGNLVIQDYGKKFIPELNYVLVSFESAGINGYNKPEYWPPNKKYTLQVEVEPVKAGDFHYEYKMVTFIEGPSSYMADPAIDSDEPNDQQNEKVYKGKIKVTAPQDRPPTITITEPTDGQAFTTDTITVSGTAWDNDDVSKVEVKVGSGNWLEAQKKESWSMSVTLAPGENTIYAKATDTSGQSREASVTVTYTTADQPPPTITITEPTNGQTFSTDTITVSGTASDNDAVSKVEVKVGSGNWLEAQEKESWSMSVTLAPGENTIYAKVTDTSGQSKEASVTVTYTTADPPPTITITEPTSGQTFATDTITVRGTAWDNDDVSKVEVEVWFEGWQEATGTESWSMSVTLSPGENTIYAKATDTSSNTKVAFVMVTYTPGQEPKLCTSADPPSHDFGVVPKDQEKSWNFDITNCGGNTLTWSVSCDQPWIKVVYPTSDGTTEESDKVTVTVDTHGLSEGKTYTGHITVTSNGGEKRGTITVNIEQTGPKLCTFPPFMPFHDFETVPMGQTRSWNFEITNCGSGTLEWTISDVPPWITVDTTSGETTTETDVVTITIDTSGLFPRTHRVDLTLNSNGGRNDGLIIVNIPDPNGPILCTFPDPLAHDFGTVPIGQERSWEFEITNCGSDTLLWEVSSFDPSWISTDVLQESTTTETDTVTVTINTSKLSYGKHGGRFRIFSNGGEKTGTITVDVSPPESEPKLCTSPDLPSHDFGMVPKDQEKSWNFEITNCGSDILTWSVSCDQPWIKVVYPTSDPTTKETDVVTVTIDTHDLTPGPHTGQITITSNGGEKTGTITVDVSPPAFEPKLCISPNPSPNFDTVPKGQTRTWDFFITNCGTGTLTWTITCDKPWLKVNPASDSTTAIDVVTVTIDTHDLSPGTHTGQITIDSNGGSKMGTVTVEVVPPTESEPTLCTSPDPPTTNFGTVPEDQTRSWDFFITNCGSGTLTWSITCDQPSWLKVNQVSDATAKEVDVVTVTIDTHDLTPGPHTGHITIDSNGGRKIGTITVNVPPPAQEPKLCTYPDPPTTNFGTVPKDQTRTWDFFITNCGSGTLTWAITCDQPSWLNVNRAMGSTTTLDVVTVTIDTHDLSPGTHTGYITLTSNGGEKTGTITVNVPSKPSTPNVEFKGIVFFPCTYSDFTGQGIEVTKILSDPNGELVKCKYVCTCWTDDTLAQIDTVAPGDEVEVYGTLIDAPDVAAEDWMIVRLETSTHYIVRLKQGPPQLRTWPTTLLHDFGTVDKDQTRTWDFDVTNCGSGTLTWSVSDDKNWISVYPTSGSTTTERDTVTVTISTSGLSPGTHTGHITLTSNGGEKTGTITVVVPKPKPQNQPPENPTLTPDRSSPQLAGTTIKWTASATDPDGDPLYYQFRLKGPATGNSWQIKRDWSTARRWTWHTTASDVGETDVSVRIRDGHHVSKSSYDLKKTVYDYKITADKKRPTATIDSITPNPATQGDDTVRFKGHGYDSDGYIVDYYWKSSKDGKLSSSKEFTKSASNLAVGTHTIYFKVKDDDGQWSDWATMTLKIEEKKEQSKYVKFRGVVTWKSAMRMGGASWVVNVDEWISGSISCDEIEVIWGSGLSSGSFDSDISTGDRVEAYGKVNPWGNDKCSVGLNDESHYIKKV